MKIFSASQHSLFVLQLLSLAVLLTGINVVSYSIGYVLLSILIYYCFSILGISMMLHRYYTHKSFKLNNILKWSLTIFAILAGRGSTIGWVYVHRIHHATSDTEKDPHSPHFDNFKFIGFKAKFNNTKQINYFIIKDLLTPAHIRIDRYYMLLIGVYILLLGLIDLNLIFYAWALPTFAVSVSQIAFNYFAHKSGYRNFDTKDFSTNNIFLWPFILGDAWHNNHHANAEKFNTKVKKFEFDPLGVLINYIKK